MQGKAGQDFRPDPYPDTTIQHMELIRIQDHDLRQLQRHNELRAFLNYERRLRAAYAKSQNPQPPRWGNPSLGRGVQGNSQLDAPC